MNYISGFMQAIIIFFIIITTPGNYSTHIMHDFLESFLHVLGLFYFIVCIFRIESQNRNTIFIYDVGIYFAIIIFPCNRFTTAGHTNMCSIKITIIFF